MARRYHIDTLTPRARVVLAEEVGHHLARVMRVRLGDALRLYDGKGREASGRVVAVRRGEVEVEVEQIVEAEREPTCSLLLAFALPKGGRAEWIFEHGTEVGVRLFQPLRCARSSFQPADERRPRWQRLVHSATGQCDRAHEPTVLPLLSFAAFVQRQDLPPERHIAVAQAPPLHRASGPEAALVVGPEGGFTDQEVALAIAEGFTPRSLGPLTLRTETAALVGAARLLA
ncbi:MAG: RsmE family RNA methyltransferase [Planctomycetota bacterium]